MNPFKFSVNETVSMKCRALTRRPAQRLAVLGFGLLVAACGGGGGDSSATQQPTLTVAEAEVQTIQSGVLVHDGFAGFLRMLNLVGATRLTGQAGQVNVACPGGGNLVTVKLPVPTFVDPSTSPTVFTLTANQCRFSSRDGLVYNGLWEVVSATPSQLLFSASGACPSTCDNRVVIVRTGGAKFGYGVADVEAPRLSYSLSASASEHRFSHSIFDNLYFGALEGSRFFRVFAPQQTNTLPLPATGVAFSGGLQIVDFGSSPSVVSTVVTINGTRDTLKITAPFNAALQVSDAGVTAAVDSYGTTPAHTSSIPWSAFLD